MTTNIIIDEILPTICTILLILAVLIVSLIWIAYSIKWEEHRNEYLKSLKDEERLIIARYQDTKPKMKELFKKKGKKTE